MAELAWQYDYFDLVGVGGRIVRRPLVPLSIGRVERGERSEFTLGLIDSGAEYTLADWTLADELGLDPTAEVEDDVVRIAVGGRAHDVHLAQVQLSLYAAPAIGGDPRSESWLADVGFIRDWPAQSSRCSSVTRVLRPMAGALRSTRTQLHRCVVPRGIASVTIPVRGVRRRRSPGHGRSPRRDRCSASRQPTDRVLLASPPGTSSSPSPARRSP